VGRARLEVRQELIANGDHGCFAGALVHEPEAPAHPSASVPDSVDAVAPMPRGGLGEAVVAAAWRQIAEHGAGSVTLRGVAREVGVTAPAVYRYFSSRDDLLTRLVIDAFTLFGDAQIAARDAVPAEDPVGRLLAMGRAYREWALNHPHH